MNNTNRLLKCAVLLCLHENLVTRLTSLVSQYQIFQDPSKLPTNRLGDGRDWDLCDGHASPTERESALGA